MKTYELDIMETFNGIKDVDLKVEFNDHGEILDIKVYSFHFIDWLSINDQAKAQWPGKYQRIQDLVFEQINNKTAVAI